jgi:hypothetical protein
MEEFKTIIDWNNSHKLFKAYEKTSNKGEVYLMGEFNKMFKITGWKRKGYQNNPDYWEFNLIPIKYEKAGQQAQQSVKTMKQKTPVEFDESSFDNSNEVSF